MDKRYLAVVACCVGLTAAGCGSSNTRTDQRATTSGPVNENVFTTDLSTLCQGAKAAGGNADKVAVALSQALPQFKAITPPPAHKAAYATFLAHLQALGTAVKNHDQGAVHAQAAKVAAATRQLQVSGCAL